MTDPVLEALETRRWKYRRSKRNRHTGGRLKKRVKCRKKDKSKKYYKCNILFDVNDCFGD